LSTELSTGLPTGRLLVRLEKKKKKKKKKISFSNKLSSERALIGYTHHINFEISTVAYSMDAPSVSSVAKLTNLAV
jgi:hypothetical protein